MVCNRCQTNIHEHSIDAVHAGLWAAHWNGKVWCGNCLKSAHVEAKQSRQAELDALPRCEFCNRRGTWNVGAGEPVLLCGWCFKKSKKHTVQSAGWFMAMHTYTGDEIRAILTGIEKLNV